MPILLLLYLRKANSWVAIVYYQIASILKIPFHLHEEEFLF